MTYTSKNIIKCRYCTYFTSRFRGKKKVGERNLRTHVLDNHEAEYKATLGFIEISADTPWTFDTLEETDNLSENYLI